MMMALLVSPLGAVPVLIGTRTGKGLASEGIYAADFDPASGSLSKVRLAARYDSPGFLVEHPTKPVLLTIGAPRKPFADGTGSVAAFAIGDKASLEFLGECSSGGKGPCHLAVDHSGTGLAVANYGDGRTSWIELDGRAVPQRVVWSVAQPGKGPNPQRQEGPHAHGVYFDASGKRLFVPDLGLDRVLVYPVAPSPAEGGAKAPAPMTDWRTAPGAGPRHLAFAPGGGHAYVVNELDNTVLAGVWENDRFKRIGTAPTLPDGFAGSNTTAEIEVSADGRFVYASNRGHDSIAVFRRDADSGRLERVQIAPCHGKAPRHFKISPCGNWLLCGHQDSNTIAVLRRDPESGLLDESVRLTACPTPICILFLR